MTAEEHRPLPRGWVWVVLSDLLKVGLSNGRSVVTATSGFPVLRLTSLRTSLVDLGERKIGAWTAEDAAPYLVQRGDFLVARGNGSIRLVGRGALLNVDPDPVAFPDTLIRVRPDERIVLPAFLAAVWHSPETRQQIERKAKTTAGIYKLNQQDLALIKLPLPPLREQQRIVDALESHLTRLDDAVATLERVDRNLKRYRASVLKAAVEGRLVPTEAALAKQEDRAYEPGSVLLERILAERRRCWSESGKKGRYQEPPPPDTTRLPDLPEGWCWATVDQLTAGGRSSGYGVLVPGPEVPGGVLLIRVGDIRDGRVHLDEIKRISKDVADQFQRTYLKGGELLISLVGSIGRTAVAPDSMAGANVARAVGVIPVTELVECHWVEHWFRSPENQSRMVGLAHEVARKTLNLEDVRSAIVAVPPLAEQARIVDAVSDLESLIDKNIRLVDLSRQRLARLRQSILKWAFGGKLADQDPSDEPASVLLERIKAERESAKSAKANRSQRSANAKKQVRV